MIGIGSARTSDGSGALKGGISALEIYVGSKNRLPDVIRNLMISSQMIKNMVNEEMDVWQDIADAVNDWSRHIIDAECLHSKSENLRCAIEASLCRQQLDGFLTVHDIAELRYISNLWVQLLNTISSYLVR